MVPQVVEKKHLSEECGCGRKLVPNEFGRFTSAVLSVTRRGVAYREVHLYQSCEFCAEVELAELEAVEERRRFTAVGVGNDVFHGYNGKRCACGAAALPAYGWCVLCWRDVRMLEKKEADCRFNRKLLNQLKESFKHVANQDNG